MNWQRHWQRPLPNEQAELVQVVVAVIAVLRNEVRIKDISMWLILSPGWYVEVEVSFHESHVYNFKVPTDFKALFTILLRGLRPRSSGRQQFDEGLCCPRSRAASAGLSLDHVQVSQIIVTRCESFQDNPDRTVNVCNHGSRIIRETSSQPFRKRNFSGYQETTGRHGVY